MAKASETGFGPIAVCGYYQRIADMLDFDRLGERLPGPPVNGFFARHGKRIRQALIWGPLLLAGLAAVLFAGDYAVLRYRLATESEALGRVTVRPYYAVRLKSGKTEFLFQDPQPETCVKSLVPHFGRTPCWYLHRHPEKRTEI
jgi:hypothetical protein